MKRIVLVALSGLLMAQADSDDGPRVTSSSKEFNKSAQAALQAFTRNGFSATLLSPELGSVPEQDLMAARAKVLAGGSLSVEAGNPALIYDVILQPGHYGRTGGRTGTGGKLISEQQIVAYVVGVAAERLRRSNLKVLVVPADGTSNGLRAKVFLAVHADGSTVPCSTGPSLAYPAPVNPYAMHAIGLATSRALGYGYSNFRRDNFTADEGKYYMFSRVKAQYLTGLLEIGELTCPDSEKRVVAGSARLGINVAQAVQFIINLQ
jgi:hypothetical protein